MAMRATGFSLIETIIVVAVIMILGSMTVPSLYGMYVRTQLRTAGEELVGALRQAQAMAIVNRSGAQWGVCIVDRTVRVFAGSCNAATESIETTIGRAVDVTGATEVVFTAGRGEPAAAATITLDVGSQQRQVSVSTVGAVTMSEN